MSDENIEVDNLESSNEYKGNDTNRTSAPTTRDSTGRKKKKKLLTPLNIEDIFSQISIQSSSVLNPPLAHIILTPRSAETCLKLGINPEILKIRDIDLNWISLN